MPHQALLKHERDEITTVAAIEWIYNELEELETGKRQIDGEIKYLREDLSVLVSELPEMTLSIPTLPKMQITAPSVRVSYDHKSIDELVRDWSYLLYQETSQEVHDLISQFVTQITNARKESQVTGSLRISGSRKQ